MKVTTFQNIVPFACARIPAKLKFAKIQRAEAPKSVPGGLDEIMSMDVPAEVKMTDDTAKADGRRAHFLKRSQRRKSRKVKVIFRLYPVPNATPSGGRHQMLLRACGSRP